MKFRDMNIDNIIVIGPTNKDNFLSELKNVYDLNDVVDLQYSTMRSQAPDMIQRKEGFALHSALILVKKKFNNNNYTEVR